MKNLKDEPTWIIDQGKKPSVAAIDGLAFGGGLELAMVGYFNKFNPLRHFWASVRRIAWRSRNVITHDYGGYNVRELWISLRLKKVILLPLMQRLQQTELCGC